MPARTVPDRGAEGIPGKGRLWADPRVVPGAAAKPLTATTAAHGPRGSAGSGAPGSRSPARGRARRGAAASWCPLSAPSAQRPAGLCIGPIRSPSPPWRPRQGSRPADPARSRRCLRPRGTTSRGGPSAAANRGSGRSPAGAPRLRATSGPARRCCRRRVPPAAPRGSQSSARAACSSRTATAGRSRRSRQPRRCGPRPTSPAGCSPPAGAC
mmetsp:Transcript_509/g.1613  ORF Transcript_509/g.1613 Transcript_509/m.1613 type:complete len:212 (-) Transcript_509:831-1466(-)